MNYAFKWQDGHRRRLQTIVSDNSPSRYFFSLILNSILFLIIFISSFENSTQVFGKIISGCFESVASLVKGIKS